MSAIEFNWNNAIQHVMCSWQYSQVQKGCTLLIAGKSNNISGEMNVY